MSATDTAFQFLIDHVSEFCAYQRDRATVTQEPVPRFDGMTADVEMVERIHQPPFAVLAGTFLGRHSNMAQSEMDKVDAHELLRRWHWYTNGGDDDDSDLQEQNQ